MAIQLLEQSNVFAGISDERSVLLLKDEDMLRRLEFIKTQMFTDWFDLEVAKKFILLKEVALKKGLFDEPVRGTISRSPDPDWKHAGDGKSKVYHDDSYSGDPNDPSRRTDWSNMDK